MKNKPTLREQIWPIVGRTYRHPDEVDEAVDKIFKLIEERIPKESTNEFWMKKLNVDSSDYSYGHQHGWNFCIDEMKKEIG